MTFNIVIPSRGLASGKLRLADRLTPAARERLNGWFLARTMATACRAVPPERVCVVSPDAGVRRFAESLGTRAVVEPAGIGLNGALALACASLREDAATRVLVLPVDLPLVTDSGLRRLVRQAVLALRGDAVLIASDHAGLGTNALAVPLDVPFEFAFGADSLARHYEEAARHGLGVSRVATREFSFDVDLPEHLDHWARDARYPETLRPVLVNRANG